MAAVYLEFLRLEANKSDAKLVPGTSMHIYNDYERALWVYGDAERGDYVNYKHNQTKDDLLYEVGYYTGKLIVYIESIVYKLLEEKKDTVSESDFQLIDVDFRVLIHKTKPNKKDIDDAIKIAHKVFFGV